MAWQTFAEQCWVARASCRPSLSCWNSALTSCCRNGSRMGWTVSLTYIITPMFPPQALKMNESWNMASSTMIPGVGSVCRGTNAHWKMSLSSFTLHNLTAITFIGITAVITEHYRLPFNLSSEPLATLVLLCTSVLSRKCVCVGGIPRGTAMSILLIFL